MEENKSMNKQQILHDHYASLGRLSHEKSPQSREHYIEIQKKSVEKRKENKAKRELLTPEKK